jgi:hypothetical protein
MNETPQKKSGWRILRRILVGIAVLATLIALLDAEEDWRGKRAWENCKRELEAKGAVLDWDKFIPPQLPDDQNFFTASTNITLRFVKAQTESQGDAAAQLQWLRLPPKSGSIVVAEVTVVFSNSNAVPKDADLYLRYAHSVAAVGISSNDVSETQSPAHPLITLKDVPLKSAIEQLARQADLNHVSISKFKETDSSGGPILVSVRWENITARQALLALLDNYDLVLVEDPITGSARIWPKKGQVYVESYATKKIGDLISGVLEQSTNGFQGVVLQGSTGISLFAKSNSLVKPLRIVMRVDKVPGVQEMSEIFLKNTVEPAGTNSFRIYGSPRIMSAEDYLQASDQFVPAFDEIREALKRPYAIIPGDYSQPYFQPIPNFVTMRALAQTLAQRTQCYLLLGQPDKALQELTLIHDVCRILEKPPTGKPETLVEAMINVAISGLYVQTVADGMRLHGWQEPQLIALQNQLAGINLPPFVVEAFREETAFDSRFYGEAAIMDSETVERMFGFSKSWKWANLKNPYFWLLYVAPRGWFYQNMVNVAMLEQKLLDVFDPAHDTISPGKVAEASREAVAFFESARTFRPYKLLAATAIPNFIRAYSTTAHNQTMVNEAQIAFALERYHLAHGEYPATLDALAPQFITQLPHDIINGQPLHYRRTDDPPSQSSGAAGGKFLLYSVGWNETDDGGQDLSTQTKGGSMDYTKGDWVWKN